MKISGSANTYVAGLMRNVFVSVATWCLSSVIIELIGYAALLKFTVVNKLYFIEFHKIKVMWDELVFSDDYFDNKSQ